MQKLLPETTWDDGNSNARGNAFLKQPKIAKPVIKAMCAATMQTYQETERAINFFNVVDSLVVMGLTGSTFSCNIVVLTQEMAYINGNLLEIVNHLKTIVWQVNTMQKNKRDAVLLMREYGNAMNAWKNKINQDVITKEEEKRKNTELKIAGYCNPILEMEEEELVAVLDSFKADDYNVTLFVSDKNSAVSSLIP